MENRVVIFEQNNKAKWERSIREIAADLTILSQDIIFGKVKTKKDFEVEIRFSKESRTGKQLKAYWRLLKIIKDYMNFQGNFYCDEEVHQWVKMSAGHYSIINNEKVARSIANDKGATKEDMIKIFDFIKHFGIEHGLKGCEIESEEMRALLDCYKCNQI